MRKRLVCFLLAAMLLAVPPAQAAEDDFIRWVDFNLTAEAMERAIALEQRLREKEIPVSWLDILALGSVRSGGKRFSAKDAEKAAAELSKGVSPEELLGAQYRYFDYYRKTYEAALGGLVGCYAVETTDAETGEKSWKPVYGVKAFSPIAEGCWYAHYRDFGSSRSFGFQRRHLGNDLLGSLGTPIVAVEGGTVEALGWNRYGGWQPRPQTILLLCAPAQGPAVCAGSSGGRHGAGRRRDRLHGPDGLLRHGKRQQHRDRASAFRPSADFRREPEGLRQRDLDRCLRHRGASEPPPQLRAL